MCLLMLTPHALTHDTTCAAVRVLFECYCRWETLCQPVNYKHMAQMNQQEEGGIPRTTPTFLLFFLSFFMIDSFHVLYKT